MIKVAIIGLDTSHSVAFAERMQAPNCTDDQRVPGMRAVACLRFETPFQNQAGLDARQAQLESWGIKVTLNFEEAIEGCDAIMLEINDGSLHREYFEKVAALGKPVFIDKPLATTLEDGRAILKLAERHQTRVWSGSSIPFCPEVTAVLAQAGAIQYGHTFGALGKGRAGDGLIWYGVHTYEMLQRLMGRGAQTVRAMATDNSVTAVITYDHERQGLVHTVQKNYGYGGVVKGTTAHAFICNTQYAYRDLLRRILAYFEGGPAPVDLAATFETLAIMIAARQSVTTGQAATVAAL